MNLGAGWGENLLGGALTGADSRVNGAPMAGEVGVFSREVKGVFDRGGQFENGIEGADGHVAVGSATEGIRLPVVGCAAEELCSQVIERQREDACKLLAGDIADLLAGALIEGG